MKHLSVSCKITLFKVLIFYILFDSTLTTPWFMFKCYIIYPDYLSVHFKYNILAPTQKIIIIIINNILLEHEISRYRNKIKHVDATS